MLAQKLCKWACERVQMNVHASAAASHTAGATLASIGVIGVHSSVMTCIMEKLPSRCA